MILPVSAYVKAELLLKPKSVIRPKQGIYQDVIASFQI